MKHALQMMNKEIHLRLKACRGQNRHEHSLLPTLDLSREIGPILENPSDGGGSSPDRCTADSPCSPEAAPGAAMTEVNWRQRLRNRGWRLPERSWTVRRPPGAKDAESLNTTLKTNRSHRSSSARSAATSTETQREEPRPVRSAPRNRHRASKVPEEILIFPSESNDGSAPARQVSGTEARRRSAGSPELSSSGMPSSQGRGGRPKQRRSQVGGRRTSTNDRRLANTRETEPAEEEAEEKREPEESASLGLGRLAPDRTGAGQKPQLALVEVEIKEVDITFQVVKWSSQRQESPAAELEKPSGWWESGNGNVEHQFVVLQTQNKEPKTVHALELSLPGNDAGPRACKLQYSTESADGPWVDAWNFQVASKTDVKCRTTFDTGSTVTKDFKEWLKKTYRGNPKEGWRHLFSENDPQIPIADFMAAIGRIKQSLPGSNHVPSWCSSEVQKLCDDLGPKDGQITLESILAPSAPPPEAPYWKLNIISNWGSQKRLQVMSPLRLTQLIQVQTGGLSRMRASFIENQAGSLAGDSLIRAFDLETLGVDSEAVQLRRLAKKYGLSILDVEDMHRLFSTFSITTDEGVLIRESQFVGMLLKLYGTDDLSEVPPQRLRFFWQQADQDGSGSIDFEEFIMWYNCYCEEILSRRKIRRRRESTEEDGRYDPPK